MIFFLQSVKTELFDKKEFFYLVGYSFGALITIELARMLEESGMTGNILLIDGAPVFLKKLSYGHIGHDVTDESIQLMLILAILQNIFPQENPADMLGRLSDCVTWQSKIDKLIEFGKSQAEYSETYMRSITEAMYNRLKVVFDYDTENIVKIKSSITLVRPTEVAVVEVDERYELARFTDGMVNLKIIDGNHMTVLENNKLANIINECDPYFVSDRIFLEYVNSGKNT